VVMGSGVGFDDLHIMKRGTNGRWFWIQFEWGEGERISLEAIVKGGAGDGCWEMPCEHVL
jgi:hypothetical protein